MSDMLGQIQKAFSNQKVLYTDHAKREMEYREKIR